MFKLRNCSLKECLLFKSGSPSVAWRLVESVGGGGSIDSVLSNLSVGVVAVPQSLEGLQVLLSVCAGASAELEVHLVRGGKGVVPSVAGQSGLPVGIVGDVDGDSTLMVGGAWGGNGVGLPTLALRLELVQEVLLGSGSPGGGEPDGASDLSGDGLERGQG